MIVTMLLVDPDGTEAMTVFCLFVFMVVVFCLFVFMVVVFCLFVFMVVVFFSTGLFIRFCDYMCSPWGLDATLPVVSLE